MALIECVLRDGVTVIDKERMRYRFVDDGSGRYVCNINHPGHLAQLLGMGEKAYREVEELEEVALIEEAHVEEVGSDPLVSDETSINDRIHITAAENPTAKASEIAKMLGVTHQKVTKILKG